MKVTGKKLFPLLVQLVKNQMRAQLKDISSFVIMDAPDKKAAGFWNPKSDMVCVNIGVLGNYLDKYEIDDNDALAQLKCGVAVAFEECHHALFDSNEEQAVAYAKSMFPRVADELLVASGGELYKRISNVPAAIAVQEEPQPEAFQLKSGGMFDFVNKLYEMNIKNTDVQGKYGAVKIENTDEGEIKCTFEINQAKLTEVKELLGAKKIGFEYGGMTYAYEDGWKTFVDIDKDNMLEITPSKKFIVNILRSGDDCVVDAIV